MIKFGKVLKVKSPERFDEKAAGVDFFVPEFTKEFINQLKEKNEFLSVCGRSGRIILYPHERILIPSGVCVKFSRGYVLKMENKSGVSSKKGLIVLASVIDENYSGQIYLNLFNSTNKIIVINENEKILQGILIPVNLDIPEEVDIKEIIELHKGSERGDKGFGSTDKK